MLKQQNGGLVQMIRFSGFQFGSFLGEPAMIFFFALTRFTAPDPIRLKHETDETDAFR